MKLWTRKEDSQKLLSIIKDCISKGETINRGCEIFIEEYPQYSIEQVRAKYYQLINSNENVQEQTVIHPWNSSEEDFLWNYCEEEFKKGKAKTKVFGEIAQKLNRNYNSVSGRYYILKNRLSNKAKTKKSNKVNVNSIVSLLNEVDIDALSSIVDTLKYIKENITDKDLEIINLQTENSKKNEEINYLQKQLLKKEKELKKITTINETYRKKIEEETMVS